MKYILTTILFTGLRVANCVAQDKDGNPPSDIVKYYYVDLLKVEDKPEIPKEMSDSLQREHMKNINSMVEEKILMLAGPFHGGGGIFILRMNSVEEAEERVKNDPLIINKRLDYRIRAWYTTKGAFEAERMYGGE